MTVSTTTTKNSYSGNGTLHSFAYGFKIFADADLSVVVRSAAGAETTKTLNTHYIVTNAGTDTGGNVLFKFNTGTSSDAHHSTSDFRPASGETVVISRALTLTQGTDYVANDPFPATSHENALDRLTMITQQQQEELDRTIKASVTNTISGAEFTISATDRANKLFSFDSSGNLSIAQELGTYRGNWAASTSYAVRDLVKDTSTGNIFICITAHTSSGSQPLTTNTDSAKWSLIVDAASATTSQTAAATSATAAATSATAAASSATAAASSATDAAGSSGASGAATSATAAASSATAAASSATSAASSLSTFQSQYHGAASSDPSSNLSTGDLYFNTSSNTLKVYNGSAWVAAAFDTSGALVAANNLSDVASAATALTNLGISSTAAELNLLDGVSGLVQADFTKLAAIDSTAAEINQLDAITRGSILYGNASGATARLAKGGASTVLTSDGTDIAWATVSTGTAAAILPSNWASPDETFTSSATYTKHSSLADDDYIWFYVVSGGGGSGTHQVNANAGYGGGAMLIYGKAGDFDQAVMVIGAGGAGSTNQQRTTGGTSSLTLRANIGARAFSALTDGPHSFNASTVGTYVAGAVADPYKFNLIVPITVGGVTYTAGGFGGGSQLGVQNSLFGGAAAGTRTSGTTAAAGNSLFGGAAGGTEAAAGSVPGGAGACDHDEPGQGGAGGAGNIRVYHVS